MPFQYAIIIFLYFHPPKIQKTNYLFFFALEKNHPEICLIITGFIQQKHPNYLDLCCLPNTLDSFLENSLSLQTKWTDLKTEGLNIASLLNVFFEGHGDESIIEAIIRVYRGLHFLRIETERFNEPYDEAWLEIFHKGGVQNDWLQLLYRWENYFPYFSCLPFYATFLEVDKLLRQIQPFFTTKGKNELLFKSLNCENSLKTIKQYLIDIRGYYV